jgi:hypothetical protein
MPALGNLVPPRTDWVSKKKKARVEHRADGQELGSRFGNRDRQESRDRPPRRDDGGDSNRGDGNRGNRRVERGDGDRGDRRDDRRNLNDRGGSSRSSGPRTPFGIRKQDAPDHSRPDRAPPSKREPQDQRENREEADTKTAAPAGEDSVGDFATLEDDINEADARRRRSGSSTPGNGSSPGARTDKKSKHSRGSVHKLNQNDPPYPQQLGDKKRRTVPGPTTPSSVNAKTKKEKTTKKVVPEFKVEREVYIPPISVKVGDLARMVDVRLRTFYVSLLLVIRQNYS